MHSATHETTSISFHICSKHIYACAQAAPEAPQPPAKPQAPAARPADASKPAKHKAASHLVSAASVRFQTLDQASGVGIKVLG